MEISKFIPLYVTYQCSKCGKMVINTHIVKATIIATNRDTIVWQGSKDDFNDKLKEKNEINFNKKIAKIYTEQAKGLYRLAEFNCKCNYCNHREPWSKMRYCTYDTIFSVLLPIGALITIVKFSIGIWILGIELLYFVLKHLHRYFIEKKIRRLPIISLPSFSLQLQESVQIFKNRLNEQKS